MSAGMVIPPVDQDGVVPAEIGAAFDDLRIPTRAGDWLDPSEVRPLGYYDGPRDGACLPPAQPGEREMARWGRQRHLFDVLVSAGQQGYGDDDQPTDVEMHLRLTCVRCGVVMGVDGRVVSDEDDGVRQVAQLDPTPLRAGVLTAQQTRADHSWADEVDATWAVYRDGARVGSISTTRGARGRRYVAGRLEGGPEAEGPTALAVLRRLDRQAAHAAAGAR